MHTRLTPHTPVTHYENFPVASWLCPPALRPPIAAIYHFARTADDLADEGTASPEQRLAQLRAYREALMQAAASPAHSFNPTDAQSNSWPAVFGPLAEVIRHYVLPTQLLNDLLDAFVQDVEKTRDGTLYRDEAELLDYCRRSANPVGRLLLHLYGIDHPLALERSDAICTALQLVNFWQDPSCDLPRGRNYFTQEAMERHGVTMHDLMQQKQTQNATQMIAAYADAARAYMEFGMPLVHQIPGRAGWELRLVVQGGLRILDKIAQMGFATLNARPALRWWDYPIIAWRALRM